MKVMVIKVAHDFSCPWCWIAIHQVERLAAEFAVSFDLCGFELMPEELPWEDGEPGPTPISNKPATPSRLALAYLASDVPRPPRGVQPHRMRTHRALLATEYAKSVGVELSFVRRLYDAYWLEGLVINEIDVLKEIAKGIVPDVEALVGSVESGEFEDRIVKFDDDAYAAGVFNVPTFFIGGERYAEQPTSVLAAAIRAELS
jgi:predicted DsbA family dithiol-disulfide isomerase